MKFSDVWGDMLHIEQEEIGTRLAIPLLLRNEALSITLSDVVSKYRDATVSKYSVHFRYSTSQVSRGNQVLAKTLTPAFKKARDKNGLTWGEGMAPTFHEQRSLSERLYCE